MDIGSPVSRENPIRTENERFALARSCGQSCGTPEGRKEFVRAFIGGITVRPDTGVLDLQMKKFPEIGKGNFTCEMVAGVRFERVQVEMRPVERFVAGVRRAA